MGHSKGASPKCRQMSHVGKWGLPKYHVAFLNSLIENYFIFLNGKKLGEGANFVYVLAF